ncbi:hypothetical protein IWX75_002717 [Arthrobacter sp. CAN_A6]|uniref:DUF6286 domain-containing protein n=1 Tax=Arthrobacter sp. CAN_A6 TaxID=2787721 RepID=UPI0018C9576E
MSPSARSQPLRRRSSRTVPATITSLILLALAVTGAWVGISRLITGTWPSFLAPIRQSLSGLTWASPAIWTAAVILTIVGLVLFLAAILPGKHTTLRLRGPDGADSRSAETVISRRGLAKIASTHLDQADGVDSASVTATARKVTADVRTPLHNAPELRGKLQSSLERKFDQIGVDPSPRVTVRVRTTP